MLRLATLLYVPLLITAKTSSSDTCVLVYIVYRSCTVNDSVMIDKKKTQTEFDLCVNMFKAQKTFVNLMEKVFQKLS